MAVAAHNQMIRKFTIAFGELFSNITLVRYNPDGTEQERFVVPVEFANKEKYVKRLEADPNLDKKVQITLPRMAYEMNGLKYDEARKQNTNIKNFYQNDGTTLSQYMPVPYNFDFSLYLMVRNLEDGHQIIEHILPYFTPDYTIKINMIPEMGIVKEVPIVLNSTEFSIDDDGDRSSDTRVIIWTLHFTVKGFVFGANSSVGLIRTSITNIFNDIKDDKNVVFNVNSGGYGNYIPGEIVYQGISQTNSTASGVVVNWNHLNKQLTLYNATGNFVSNVPLKGGTNNAVWTFNSYAFTAREYSQIVITPSPTDANANSYYTATKQISETTFVGGGVPVISTDLTGDINNQYGIDDLMI